jgi:hypothetical protein
MPGVMIVIVTVVIITTAPASQGQTADGRGKNTHPATRRGLPIRLIACCAHVVPPVPRPKFDVHQRLATASLVVLGNT